MVSMLASCVVDGRVMVSIVASSVVDDHVMVSNTNHYTTIYTLEDSILNIA
jgi:hypothetical protein